MDITELTEKAVTLAAKDEKLKEKTKDTVATFVVKLKNGEEISFTASINKGELKFSRESIADPDFQIEISKENFYKWMTKKTGALMLMATKKAKITKGSIARINKILPTLTIITEYGKEIAEKEGM